MGSKGIRFSSKHSRNKCTCRKTRSRCNNLVRIKDQSSILWLSNIYFQRRKRLSKISKEEWIDNLCREHKIIDTRVLSTPQIQMWLDKYNNFFGGMCTEESFRRLLRKGKRNLLIELQMLDIEEPKDPDKELVEANVRYQKDKQKFQDISRIERKAFREYARVENAVSEYGKELVKILKEYGKELAQFNPVLIKDYERDEVGMIQITDTHLNELINLPHNKYDISIASKRLFKLYKESLSMFKARGIKEIVVAFTGDLLNSDRRLDELLNQANNRTKATFVSAELFLKFLLQLSQHFKVSVVSVLGNESRVNKEMSFSAEALSDSYDLMIIGMVKEIIQASNNPNITFGSIDDVETIIEIKKNKILLTHDLPRATESQKGTQSVIGMKYLQGTPCDYMIAGHIHSPMNQIYGFRSSALCGSNSYSDNALHLAGRAGQNIYFIGEGYVHAMGIDLQKYTDEWFDINDKLMEYHCKSVEKTKQRTTVMSIVI